MDILEINTTNRRQVKAFLDLPFRLYQHTPQWVPPLWIDARRMLDQRRHPFYRHSQAAFFLACDAGQVIGRLAVLENQRYNTFNRERTAFFYLFECEDAPLAAQELFSAARQWARDRDLEKITGPKGFTPFDGIGLLVKGFEHRPAFGLPYNLPYYSSLMEAAGLHGCGEMVSGYLSAHIEFPDHIRMVAQALKRRRGLQVAEFKTRDDLRRLAPYLKELHNNSLEGTTGTVPLTDEEVQTLADQMLWFADPRLIKIVFKDDTPVGFLFAYPDISAALQRTRGKVFPLGWLHLWREIKRTTWININGAGMSAGYRGVGGTALLFDEMYRSVVEAGYDHVDLVQIGTENDRMLRELRELGIEFYKTHRLYEGNI